VGGVLREVTTAPSSESGAIMGVRVGVGDPTSNTTEAVKAATES
jgi:hypothetical protein